MSFCTVINCMDGRVQLPVNTYLRDRFKVEYVDSITDAGPVRILSDAWDSVKAQSIVNNLGLSIDRHRSVGVAVVCHYDCAGNPVSQTRQIEQLHKAVDQLRRQAENLETIGLWVDKDWLVHEFIS